MEAERVREAYQAIQFDPTNPQPHLVLAKMHAERGQWSEALTHSQEAALHHITGAPGPA